MRTSHNILAADVICLAETWLNASDHNEQYMIEGYKIVRLDQENKAYGHHGLLVYVHDHIVIEDVKKYLGANFEAINLALKKTTCYHI